MITRECTFKKCQTCQHKECVTGQIARESGEEAYKEYVSAISKVTNISEEEDNKKLAEEKRFYAFKVRLCNGMRCKGEIRTEANSEEEAYDKALTYVCDKLAKALPELDIEVTVELE